MINYYSIWAQVYYLSCRVAYLILLFFVIYMYSVMKDQSLNGEIYYWRPLVATMVYCNC